MRALVITGSRADRNGLELIAATLTAVGHEAVMHQLTEGYCWHNLVQHKADMAIIGGDRFEVLQAAIELSASRTPIAHIAGGDITEGSADDRYRDAITALSCIHFATNEDAYLRLTQHLARHPDDRVYLTGSPAIDRVKQTPVLKKWEVYQQTGLSNISPIALVCVHPNTDGKDPLTDFQAVATAIKQIGLQCIWLGANADLGGEIINFEIQAHGWTFHNNVSPQLYYSLMTHCDVMIGNSSAMLYEAPEFGIPCVLTGYRQDGRILPNNVYRCITKTEAVLATINQCLEFNRKHGRLKYANPYGDGHSAPRIVKALEDNAWRWESKTSELSHVKHARHAS